MIPKEVEGYFMKSVKQLITDLGLEANDWNIDFAHASNEGHGYFVGDTYYEEHADIAIEHLSNKDSFDIWVDVAFVKGLKEPILFIENISSSNPGLMNKYGIKNLSNPEEYLQTKLSHEQYSELMNQPYFAEGRHMSLWKDIRNDV